MKNSKKALILAGIMAAAMTFSGCQTEEKTPVILAVSFGTSFDDNREETIGAVENAIREANPDYEVRRAFTSQIVIDVIKENGGAAIDNVEEAFDRLVEDGVKELVVQPTHVMSGFEYDDLMAVIDEYEGQFDKLSVGAPLLTSDADYTTLADALVADTAAYNVDGTAVVFMGHGTHHEANATYGKLQETFTAKGNANYFVVQLIDGVVFTHLKSENGTNGAAGDNTSTRRCWLHEDICARGTSACLVANRLAV